MQPHVARERVEAKKERAARILDRLAAHMPGAHIELRYASPLELLVAVILSAQCTDKRVNLVTPRLFADFPDARAYARASPPEIEPYIQSCGLYRNKAKSLVLAGRALVERYGGEVPKQRAQLETLPGVGRKTAGVVAMHLGGDAAFPVDTHVRRLSQRMGLSRQEQPDKVEQDLRALVPQARWAEGHHLLIWHGRRTCFARAPACARCPVADLCPRLGVSKGRPSARRGSP